MNGTEIEVPSPLDRLEEWPVALNSIVARTVAHDHQEHHAVHPGAGLQPEHPARDGRALLQGGGPLGGGPGRRRQRSGRAGLRPRLQGRRLLLVDVISLRGAARGEVGPGGDMTNVVQPAVGGQTAALPTEVE